MQLASTINRATYTTDGISKLSLSTPISAFLPSADQDLPKAESVKAGKIIFE